MSSFTRFWSVVTALTADASCALAASSNGPGVLAHAFASALALSSLTSASSRSFFVSSSALATLSLSFVSVSSVHANASRFACCGAAPDAIAAASPPCASTSIASVAVAAAAAPASLIVWFVASPRARFMRDQGEQPQAALPPTPPRRAAFARRFLFCTLLFARRFLLFCALLLRAAFCCFARCCVLRAAPSVAFARGGGRRAPLRLAGARGAN